MTLIIIIIIINTPWGRLALRVHNQLFPPLHIKITTLAAIIYRIYRIVMFRYTYIIYAYMNYLHSRKNKLISNIIIVIL